MLGFHTQRQILVPAGYAERGCVHVLAASHCMPASGRDARVARGHRQTSSTRDNTMNPTTVLEWSVAWQDIGLPAPPRPVFDAVIRGWAEPHRRYHTLQHLHECLALFESIRALAERPGEVALAVWFHDAIYDTGRHDNEARSADWARQVLLEAGATSECAARVHALIMATCHGEMPVLPDARLLVDIDLAILGAAPARFEEYERQIRAEYGFVPEALFRVKRAEILRGFLDRPALFSTPGCAARFDAPARVNLARALVGLG